MSERPDISAIIVTWNTRDMTLDCIERLRENLGALKSEIFVVDNGSSDGTAEAVAGRFADVRVIANDENRGFAAANNQAIAAAAGRYVLLLNSDAIVSEKTVAGLVDFMDATPRAGAAGAQLVSQSGELENSAAAFPSLSTELLNKSLLRALRPGRHAAGRVETDRPLKVDSVLGACMIVRREAINAVGALDEGYFFFLEETDWCRRMRDAGWEIFLVPAARAVHLKGKSKSAFRAAARVEYLRSLYRYFRKHRGLGARFLLRAGKAAKVFLNFILLVVANCLTLFCVKDLQEKLRASAVVLGWHVALCPVGWGLPRKKVDTKIESAV